MAVEVFMPKMTDNMSEGIVVNWLVKDGDHVERGQPIMEVETDKAIMEIEAASSGVIKGIREGITSGIEVPTGEILAFIVDSPNDAIPSLPAFQEPLDVVRDQPAQEPHPDQSTREGLPPGNAGLIQASPAVRRIARELGVDLALARGTGPGGRIREADVRTLVEAEKGSISESPLQLSDRFPTPLATPIARRLAVTMGIDLSNVRPTHAEGKITKDDVLSYAGQYGLLESESATSSKVDWLELNRTQILTGRRMLESVRTAPQFSITVSVDMTNALQKHKTFAARIEVEKGVHLSVTGLTVKVVADALEKYPRANASFVEERIRLHKQINIGVAVGTTEGLVVPVIHNANTKSLDQIALELNTFQDNAKRMRFSADNLTGGTFTISNLGMLGIEQFQAIINPPESAILAIGQILNTPVGMPDGTISLRPIMKMTLSVDHRSLDGVLAAEFLSLIKEALQEGNI